MRVNREAKIIIGILSVPVIFAILGGAGESPTWFPESLNYEFYIFKGVLALTATVLVLVHMDKTWGTVETFGRQLRYLCLLYFVALVTSSSLDQIRDQVDVDYRNMGGLIGAVLVLVAMAVSLREDFQRERS